MISFADFKDPATGLVDWDACKRAEIAAGEACQRCMKVYSARVRRSAGLRRLPLPAD